MAMLTLNGQVANLYESPRGVNKTTGEAYGGQNRLQLICENVLQNGEKKIELVDLVIDDVTPFRAAFGQVVSVPVGVYINAGKPAFYALKNQGQVA